ncbi:MAG: ATP-binding protein, partial [Pyrinomonadaceae bacterium]
VGVDSPERFERFFRLICTWTGHELNASAISRDLGIPVNTIRRWIDALERSFLVEIIQPYSRNASQRVIKAPKVFVIDPALALAGAREVEPNGFHLETLICMDLLQWRDEIPNRAIYHWRLAGGQEVDFVLQQNQQLLPVEIKATTNIQARHTKHLRAFRDKHSNSPRGILLSCDPQIKKLDGGLIAAPWWAVI